MASIYRKTAQGLDEIETRARHLTPRYRTALIMVDGKRHDDELRKLIGNDADATLQHLVDQGLIELAGAAAATAKPAAKPAAGAAAAAAPAASPAAAPVEADFHALRRDAVRAVNDALGPMGEALAMKMEAAANLMQLRPLLEKAVTVIGNARGGGAAAQFAVRFLEVAATR